MATAPSVTYNQSLPSGANGAPIASYNATGAVVPESVPSPETLSAYHAQSSGSQLTPEQELLILRQQQRQEQIAKAQGKNMALQVAGTVTSTAATVGMEKFAGKAAANIVGPVGHIASAGMAVVGGDMEAKQRLSELVSIHFEDLEREFGVKPEEVTDAHLRRLAELPAYPQLKKEIQGLDQKIGRALTNTAASAGTFALTGMALAPIVAGAAMTMTGVGAFVGIPAMITGTAVFVASAATSMVASSVADKAVTSISGVDPIDSAYSQLTIMQQKLEARQPVDQIDVFTALLAGDAELQKAVSKQTGGKKFAELSPEAQLELLQTHHVNLLDASRQLAYQINCGETLPSRIISLDTVALSSEGAQAAYDLTRHDKMRGAGTNILQGQQATNQVVPFGKPSYSISTNGAVTTPMQREQGIGAQEAGVMARQAQAAGMSQQLGG